MPRCPVRRSRSSRACPTGIRAFARWLSLALPEHGHTAYEVAARPHQRMCRHSDLAVLAVQAPYPSATMDRPQFPHRNRQRNLLIRQVVTVLVPYIEGAIALFSVDHANFVEALAQQPLGRLVE